MKTRTLKVPICLAINIAGWNQPETVFVKSSYHKAIEYKMISNALNSIDYSMTEEQVMSSLGICFESNSGSHWEANK